MSGGQADPLAGLPAEVRETLDGFREGVLECLGEELLAIYLSGSAASGDLTATSDLDFLVLSHRRLRWEAFRCLQELHRRLSQRAPWGSRLEGGYAGREQVQAWGLAGEIAAIEPAGELHWTPSSDYGPDDMAGIRAGGLSLYGPPAAETLVKVPERIVREGYREWGESLAAEGEWLKEPPTVLAARVLNLIRCVHGWETGGLASKAEAAAWLGRQDRSLGGLARQAMEIRSATEGISPDELRWRFPELARWAKGRLRSGAS